MECRVKQFVRDEEEESLTGGYKTEGQLLLEPGWTQWEA